MVEFVAGLGLQYEYNCILKDSSRVGDDDDVEGNEYMCRQLE